jgi:type IV secretion system protein VirB10
MIDPTPPLAPDRRPAVARVASDRGVWIFAGLVVLGGSALFGALESHRATLSEPAIAPEPDSAGAMIAPPPELSLPPAWQEPPQPTPTPAPLVAPLPPITATPPPTARRAPVAELTQPPFAISTPAPMPAPATTRETAEVVFRGSTPAPAKPDGAGTPSGKSERVEASRFTNPATTVPKGTVMQAVLESALDSTRAGMARAIISRDIYGFDGTKILIPRGSRLIGEYKADVQQGQSRALIEWQRLMRPDGAIINLDSPSADPLGRAGIKGKVNSHFFARYSGAILQSALDIGDQVAINKLAPATTIYAVPSLYGLQSATQGVSTSGTNSSQTIQPTLTVKQGTSVSVFVAHDLDFTSVDP